MIRKVSAVFALFGACALAWAGAKPDETPTKEGEWGFRPGVGEVVSVNPPRFSWRPQKGKGVRYVVEASRDASFEEVEYTANGIEFNVHAPDRRFDPGEWAWRYAYVDATGNQSEYSSVRRFTIPGDAVRLPIPGKAELLSRVPTTHPRLFVRPEWMPTLRERAKGDLKPEYDRLIAQCEKWIKNPPKVEEPPKYPPGTDVKSEQWREYWHRGMVQTPATLDPMVTLGLAYQLSGDRRYGEAGKRILMLVAKWDPHGATGYLYNDEAGMPYNYLFARGYTFLNDLLTDEEREECRLVMRIRGEEMYHHLCPSHFWEPYKSHQNRAWHFLGEVAVAFHGEIPEADDWLWFSVNVFANVYPVWNDSDGGWHEGIAYWRSYMERFSWWADVMKAAVGIDAYKLPFFSQAGYYPMYVQPPGTKWGGFGDQNQAKDSAGNVRLMDTFASQAGNPYWRWYAEAQGVTPDRSGYVGFIRAATLPDVTAKPPTDLPSSRVFHGVGQAYLNSDLLSAKDNVEVLFKSSPMGTQSHGYNAQNAFELYAYGIPLLLSSGQRDLYGSDHHANWMWETKSCNDILVGGRGQGKHSKSAVGRISGFSTSPSLDWVRGEAAEPYQPALKRFTRDIIFAKPDLVVIYDRIEAQRPETFQWLLHAQSPMSIANQSVHVEHQGAAGEISFLYPTGLKLSQTDKFDHPPRERVKLTQYHLTAETAAKSTRQEFVTVIRVGKSGSEPAAPGTLAEEGGVHVLRSKVGEDDVTVRLSWDKDVEATITAPDGAKKGSLP